ncbi:NAD-dependent malic enzyme [Legionella jordanis]|uniref:Malolactic enzyme n=1 Tax=Legionella jordanis TaxID=456 RepID=A0A0W0V821_9GAMM|nr:NAD-dependent malic enzyme [Legionella jordanis]KTD16223.1 malate oxidoreductase [Legionella jordanis]RMX04557.1 NAD-dependent malic enzyme [Legionella jordanis]VEH12319.1 malate oxidoreductase [Legionella jordanis]HAT8713526.1 oxaloacetate-decarboxylating malate dehydrogenase [Legionella jordanis]
MLDFKVIRDEQTGELVMETSICGKPLLTTPQLNKSTAFTREERQEFGLMGKLPHRVETLDEQVKRAYLQYSSYSNRLQQNIYLNNLHDKNQVLFFKLISKHLGEMLPTIYTPIVGTAVKRYSHEYRQPRGLYIAHSEKNYIEEIINNRSNPEIDLIVVTDGEGVLGIGDQGIGGMDIPVAKLMVYTLCGGLDPTRTLPVFLDVGTNNQDLLNDPLYLGCQHPRIPVEDYDDFILTFVNAIHKHFPNAFLHWEDFGRSNARRILDKFQDKLCTFNDDIQGTGAVTLAALLAACDVTGIELENHRIVVYGAGSAGTGISDQIVDAMVRRGHSPEEAYSRFWLIDRQGLLVNSDLELTEAQKPYARKPEEIESWYSNSRHYPSLTDTVRQIRPTILIGCSAQPGAFSQDIIEIMSSTCERPIVFPLSNPDDRCEAQPADIMTWSEGRALIATGTAFPAVEYQNRLLQIAQCNNALVFPGIGLGVLAVKALRLSKGMIWAAAEALSEFAPSKKDSFLPLLPSLDDAQVVAKHIAVTVARKAIEENLAQINQDADLETIIKDMFWEPRYLPFRKIKTKPA